MLGAAGGASEAPAAATPADSMAIGSSDPSVREAKDSFAQLNAQMEANLAAVEERRAQQDASFTQ